MIETGREQGAPKPNREPADCDHPEVNAIVDFNRILDDPVVGLHFSADLQITCTACGEPFVFLGLQPGLSGTEPRRSLSATEVHLPIQPASYEGPAAHYGYDISATPSGGPQLDTIRVTRRLD